MSDPESRTKRQYMLDQCWKALVGDRMPLTPKEGFNAGFDAGFRAGIAKGRRDAEAARQVKIPGI